MPVPPAGEEVATNPVGILPSILSGSVKSTVAVVAPVASANLILGALGVLVM